MRSAGKVTVYYDGEGEWRWRCEASNGLTVADSGQGYSRRADAVAAAKRVFDPEWPIRLRVEKSDLTVDYEKDSIL